MTLPMLFHSFVPYTVGLSITSHPAQSNMTKCKITLIHDLQLFCDVATNKTQQCCCLLCRMQAKKKGRRRKQCDMVPRYLFEDLQYIFPATAVGVIH